MRQKYGKYHEKHKNTMEIQKKKGKEQIYEDSK